MPAFWSGSEWKQFSTSDDTNDEDMFIPYSTKRKMQDETPWDVIDSKCRKPKNKG